MREKMMLNGGKRSCRPTTFNAFDIDTSPNGNMEKEPFCTSGDESDVDYQLPPAKKTPAHAP